MDLMNVMKVSGTGMRAQSARMQVISENIANADSLMNADGTGPYRRQQVFFKATENPTTGLTEVKVAGVTPDYATPLRVKYDPGNPLADKQGLVKMPNVDTTLESVDMKEAARAYEANMTAIENTKQLMLRTMDLLR